jgi:hypothetical protein
VCALLEVTANMGATPKLVKRLSGKLSPSPEVKNAFIRYPSNYCLPKVKSAAMCYLLSLYLFKSVFHTPVLLVLLIFDNLAQTICITNLISISFIFIAFFVHASHTHKRLTLH